MIIPMTALVNSFDDSFKNYLGLNDEERIIFGFICFDSEDIGFFKDEDVNIGYILSDFISLYISIRIRYTIDSNVFNDSDNKFQSDN